MELLVILRTLPNSNDRKSETLELIKNPESTAPTLRTYCNKNSNNIKMPISKDQIEKVEFLENVKNQINLNPETLEENVHSLLLRLSWISENDEHLRKEFSLIRDKITISKIAKDVPLFGSINDWLKDTHRLIDFLLDDIKKYQKTKINKSSNGTSKKITINNSRTAVVGNNNTIINKSEKKVKNIYPPTSIGYDPNKKNYISHLIGRYNDYQKVDIKAGKKNYAQFGAHLKKEFKVGPTSTIYSLHVDKFELLSSYIQERIDKTKIGKINLHKMISNYSTFDQYINDKP